MNIGLHDPTKKSYSNKNIFLNFIFLTFIIVIKPKNVVPIYKRLSSNRHTSLKPFQPRAIIKRGK